MSEHGENRKKAESLAAVLKRYAAGLLEILVSTYMVLTLAVLPFYFRQGYSYIATDKAMLFRGIVRGLGRFLLLALPLFWIFSLVVRKREAAQKRESFRQRFRSAFSPLDGFLGLYGAAVAASYFYSRYREYALWGAEGWFMGLFTQLALVCSYFLISRLWHPRRSFFYLMYPVSGVVFLLGYLNRFDIYPIQMEMSSPSFISTVGNINWYCGYVVPVFFAGAAYFWRGGGKKGWQAALLSFYIWLGFATLITQGSASGIVALVTALLVMFCLSAGKAGRMRRFWAVMLLFSLACLFTMLLRLEAPERITYQDIYIDVLMTGPLPVFLTAVSGGMAIWLYGSRRKGIYPAKGFRLAAVLLAGTVGVLLAGFCVLTVMNTLRPGSIGELSSLSLFTFSDAWGSNRGATWKAGFFCFWEQDFLHKLVGIGPDAMAAYIHFYGDASQKLRELVLNAFGGQTLTNAHGELLTILADIGILGLIGYGGGMFSAIGSFLRKGENPVSCACGVAVLAYTANNLFSFQQTLNAATLFVLLGMGEAFRRRKQRPAMNGDTVDGTSGLLY